MFRKIGFGAAAALTVGLLAVGCSEDGDTIIQGGGLLATDNFPGGPIQNVADDQRAFSIQAQEYEDDVEVFWNVATGEAIALFTTQDDSTNINTLWAAYFNSSTWAAPVQIRGQDSDSTENPTSSVVGFKVCWINTSTTSGNVPEVAARNGDAVILFTREDLGPQPGLTTEENSNVRLWMAYFDRSAATAAAANGYLRGFSTEAITVDDDNLITSGGDDPDVSDFGFVTDSLQGTHFFDGDTNAVDSGNPTTALNIVFRKDPGSGTLVGQRFLAKAILGDAATNDLTTLLDTQETLAPATNALTTGESVNGGFVVHNNHMIWTHTVVDAATTDTPATITLFNEDGVEDEVALGDYVDSANDTQDAVRLPSANNVYGGDHGLASLYIIFQQFGGSADTTPQSADGEPAIDEDLFVAQVDLDATTLAADVVQIDAFSDTVNLGTAGTDADVALDFARDITNVESRINRTAEYITILFNQQNTDVDTDTNLNPINTNNVLYVTVVQTRKRAATGTTAARDIVDSVYDDDTGTTTIFEPLLVPSQLASGTTAAGIEDDVDNVDFQIELAQGQAVSQSDELLDPACGIQANAYRMNFIYTQAADGVGSSGTGADEERLLVNGVEVDLGDTATDAPAVTLVDSTEEVIATRDTDTGMGIPTYSAFNALAADAGDSTRDNTGAPSGDSGRPLVFYLLNGNNPADNSVTGAFTETRVFVWDAGSSELLSTDGAREFDQVTDFAGAITVPVNRTATHHAGTTLHVLWVENVDNGPGQRLVTRSYDKGAINDGATTNDTLENRFTPNLVGGTAAEDPVQIDNPTTGVLLDEEFALLRDGSTVGVYFDEDGHVYYSDTSSDARGWDSDNGVAAPQLVDNDAATGLAGRIEDADVFAMPDCENLRKSMVFFTRRELQNNNDERLLVRVHN